MAFWCTAFKRFRILGLIYSRIMIIENPMAKAKVTFKPMGVTEGEWNILAELPGRQPIEITGFKSKTEIDEWINGDRRIAWLRSQGYAK
jgi:hypothetical protein